ncbi:hypothetical protein [Variovorax sp. PCZ-1]|uniref:hypothetical protein n=1 Tax=Variovorax sp. PCZ-1 TaxID=2835533 RepID=UPI001BCD9B61|nr:hypothetical protein [Variovorax sp. PCZ-1]MBS7806299.1 hypothetical protein [Variovorax sp. PCZ-1]
MSQVTIYLEEDTLAAAKASAARAKMSLSSWMAKLVKEQAPAQDANGYPLGFFERIEANAHAFEDFPSLDAIRAKEVPDLPREVM